MLNQTIPLVLCCMYKYIYIYIYIIVYYTDIHVYIHIDLKWIFAYTPKKRNICAMAKTPCVKMSGYPAFRVLDAVRWVFESIPWRGKEPSYDGTWRIMTSARACHAAALLLKKPSGPAWHPTSVQHSKGKPQDLSRLLTVPYLRESQWEALIIENWDFQIGLRRLRDSLKRILICRNFVFPFFVDIWKWSWPKSTLQSFESGNSMPCPASKSSPFALIRAAMETKQLKLAQCLALFSMISMWIWELQQRCEGRTHSWPPAASWCHSSSATQWPGGSLGARGGARCGPLSGSWALFGGFHDVFSLVPYLLLRLEVSWTRATPRSSILDGIAHS